MNVFKTSSPRSRANRRLVVLFWLVGAFVGLLIELNALLVQFCLFACLVVCMFFFVYLLIVCFLKRNKKHVERREKSAETQEKPIQSGKKKQPIKKDCYRLCFRRLDLFSMFLTSFSIFS